jgi:hypothetical protein
MNRRRLLVTGLSGVCALAGCVGGSPETTTPSDTATGTVAPTQTRMATGDGTNRTVAVTDTGTLEIGGVSTAIDRRKAEITADHTAELVLSLHNRSSESVTRSYTLPRGQDILVGTHSSGNARLLLVSEEEGWKRADGNDGMDENGADDCWQPDARVLARGTPDTRATIRLASAETWRKTYECGTTRRTRLACLWGRTGSLARFNETARNRRGGSAFLSPEGRGRKEWL